MEVTKQLLLNLMFLLVLLFFYQIYADKWWNRTPPKWIIHLVFIFSIVVSLFLSIKVGGTAQLDFRHIPYIVGCLYFGRESALLLFLTTNVSRTAFGINTGFWISFIVFGIHTLVCLKLHKKFLKQSIKNKIMISSALSIFHSTTILMMMMVKENPIPTLELWFGYIIIPALGTGLGTYSIESWRKGLFLRQKVILLEKTHSSSNMSAAISHEVRNPLTTIRGFLQLLKDNGFDESKRNEFVNISIEELDRAQKIITDYLAYTKPHPSDMGLIHINEEILQLLNIITPLANLNGITIEYSLKCHEPIKGDKYQFHQSLLNIIKNCIEAMPSGGKLFIKTHNDQQKTFISIKDTGIGMTEEQIQKIGEPYFSTKGAKGTGLGMMVSLNIIKDMNGTLKVESHLGEGSLFDIQFPSMSPRYGSNTPTLLT